MREYFGQIEEAKYAVGSATNIAVVLHADLRCVGMRLLSAHDLDVLAERANDDERWQNMVRCILKFRLDEVLQRLQRRYLKLKGSNNSRVVWRLPAHRDRKSRALGAVGVRFRGIEWGSGV
jgi:hypothetical protein